MTSSYNKPKRKPATTQDVRFKIFLRDIGSSYSEFMYDFTKEQKMIILREYIADKNRIKINKKNIHQILDQVINNMPIIK